MICLLPKLSKRDLNLYSILFINIFLALIFCSNSAFAQTNISQGKPVSMSSIDRHHDGHFIVDGEDAFTKEDALGGPFFSKTVGGQYQWIQIDLEQSYDINKVILSTAGLEYIYKSLQNNNLILAVSDDPKFKDIYNPKDCSSLGIKTKRLALNNNVYASVSITPVNEKMIGRYVRIWDLDSGGIIFSEVKINGNLSAGAVSDAVKSGDVDKANQVLLERIESGGSVDQEATLKLAIDQKNSEMVQTVLSNNKTVSSSVFEYALGANYNSKVALQLLSSGDVDLSTVAIDAAIKKRDNTLIKKMLGENASVFNNNHVDAAFNSNQTDIATEILDRAKLTPSTAALSSVIKSGNMLVVSDMINKYGASPNSAMLTDAIKAGNQSIINLLLIKVKPNSEAYVVAAKKNDLELYQNLTSTNDLPDNRSIEAAIDNGYLKIVKNGLQSGGKASDALSYAVTKNKPEIVNYLITIDGVDLNPVLDYAVSKNDKTLFSKLLNEYNADAETGLAKAITANKDNLAIIALETGNTNPSQYLESTIKANKDVLAKKIVDFGGDPDQGMETAINMNKTNLVEYFIEKNASVSNIKFMEVAAKSNLQITKMLIDNGADANNGMSSASSENQLEIVTYLLENGADANKGIVEACTKGHLDIVTLLIDNGADAQLGIKNAVVGNHTQVALLLLDNNADATDKTFIQTAASNNNEKLAIGLIDNGANAQNGVASAIESNASEVFQVLLDNEIQIKDPQHMEIAARNSAYKIVPMLVEQGITMDYKAPDGSSFIHLNIASGNNLNTVMALLKAGVSPNSKDNNGNSLIHFAAIRGRDYIPIIQALVEAGGDINSVNNNGETPRKVAKHQKAKTAIKRLGGERKIKN